MKEKDEMTDEEKDRKISKREEWKRRTTGQKEKRENKGKRWNDG